MVLNVSVLYSNYAIWYNVIRKIDNRRTIPVKTFETLCVLGEEM